MSKYPKICPLVTSALTELLESMAFNYLCENGQTSHIGDGTTLITFAKIAGSAEMLLGEVIVGAGAAGIGVHARVPMVLANGWWLLVEIIADGSMFAIRYDSVELASDDMMQPSEFVKRIQKIQNDPLFIIENCQRGGIVLSEHRQQQFHESAGSIESVSSIKSEEPAPLQEIWSANMDPDRKYAYHLHNDYFYILGY